MTSPAWSPVDEPTGDLLALVAHDETHPRPAEEWDEFVRAVETVAAIDGGTVSPNAVRPRIRGLVAPRRIGAFYRRALLEGLLRTTGEWVISDDADGRNAGRPCRVYALASPVPAAVAPPATSPAVGTGTT